MEMDKTLECNICYRRIEQFWKGIKVRVLQSHILHHFFNELLLILLYIDLSLLAPFSLLTAFKQVEIDET